MEKKGVDLMAYGKFNMKIYPDENLSKILGSNKPIPPTEMTKLIWKYIKKHKLSRKE